MNTQITLQHQGLDCPLGDGQTAYFNYFWLRDNCPTSFDSNTRERVFDVFGLGQPPRPERADISADALEIRWQGEEHVSRHPLSFLRAHTAPGPRRDVADLSRKLWYGDHYPDIHRFSQPALMADPALVKDWARTLLEEGVAIITDMPGDKEGLSGTAGLLGYIRASFFGDYFDVKTHINPTNLAFTAKALEMHTDLPAEDLAPGIQYLHCIANTVEGGNSLFLDGAALAEDFRLSNPEDFALLASTDIPFYCEHEKFDMRARQRVIELDRYGAVSGLTISGHLADVFDLSQDYLDRFYPAYWRFGQLLTDPKYLMRFRLNAGECIVFDNHRIVHGREGYTASSGDRHLRGCYTDRGELRSTYRALSNKGETA
ncbi:TauD/TfdA family dioxygenase [Candidatus Halocynthiibacter alkanivorans]|uniref:TauD/TfdA family dioxygenase n=1 Tax=Candidatus Halocynthiibacter alkanivorans TaxID=2267619 RepID=UPI001F1EB4B8|nr:TauD/TfdA family dioxygenase [Candidatus Halocynthiibacter alkanivorans]